MVDIGKQWSWSLTLNQFWHLLHKLLLDSLSLSFTAPPATGFLSHHAIFYSSSHPLSSSLQSMVIKVVRAIPLSEGGRLTQRPPRSKWKPISAGFCPFIMYWETAGLLFALCRFLNTESTNCESSQVGLGLRKKRWKSSWELTRCLYLLSSTRGL